MYEKTDWEELACQLGCMSSACVDVYNKLLEAVKDHPEKKRIRELAAMYLPQGIMTQHVETINFRSLKNFLTLRDSPYAQKEIQHIAQLMKQELSKIDALKATNKYFLKI